MDIMEYYNITCPGSKYHGYHKRIPYIHWSELERVIGVELLLTNMTQVCHGTL